MKTTYKDVQLDCHADGSVSFVLFGDLVERVTEAEAHSIIDELLSTGGQAGAADMTVRYNDIDIKVSAWIGPDDRLVIDVQGPRQRIREDINASAL